MSFDAEIKPMNKADYERRVRRAIDRIYSHQLSKVLLVMMGYYSLITVSHYFFLSGEVRTALMFLTSLTAFFSAVVYALNKYRLLRQSQSHASFIVPGMFGVAAVYVHVFLTNDQLQLTNGILILFAFGFITLSRRVFALFFITNSALYISVIAYVPGENTVHFIFMYAAAAALGILCFVLRYRTTISAQRLLAANRHKASQLVAISKQMQIETEQARIAAESAEKANKAKDAFLANTTHELRTPLTGVLGMLDLLDDNTLLPQQREAVRAAQFSARTLLVVVNDLLDLAKIDAGTFELKSVPFSLPIVTAHVCDLLRPQADAKGLKLNVVGLDEIDQPLIGDPVRIGQVVLNLLDNAIKFTHEGSVTVTVALDQVEIDNGHTGEACLVSIAVRDTGIGLSADDWARVFTRFEQLDNSTTRQAEGAGLGLSICQSLAMHMKGNISVDSAEGQGSEFKFTVTLPAAKDLEGVDLSLVSKPSELDSVQKLDDASKLLLANELANDESSLKPRILFAEDNKVNQMLVQKLAHKFNWNLHIVSDGEAAVRCVEENDPFDVILMDIRMPGMDGVEATKLIKKMPAFRGGTPVIALTANTSPEDVQTYLNVGMVSVISKPIEATALKKAVDEILAVKVNE